MIVRTAEEARAWRAQLEKALNRLRILRVKEVI